MTRGDITLLKELNNDLLERSGYKHSAPYGAGTSLSCFDSVAKRECFIYALVTVFHSYSA
jgi:hypothetical protein